jgi:hypothetical protein
VVAQAREVVNVRNGDGQPRRIGLEPVDVVHAAHGQAPEVAADTHLVVVHQGGDVDDTGQFEADEF